MGHLHFQINFVQVMSVLVLSGISLASPIFGGLWGWGKEPCAGYFHANLSRAQCLQYPHATGWNSSMNAALSECQTRRAMKKYRKKLTGLCYNQPGCMKGRINLPYYEPWPPELCHERKGRSFKLKPGSTESCLTRDQLAGLMSSSSEVPTSLVSDVVVWGNCYLPEPPKFTVGVRPSRPPDYEDPRAAPPPYIPQ